MNLNFMKHKSNIHILELNAYTAPRVFEERNDDFVSIGDDNNYYQYIIDRYIGSTTNHAILNGVTNFVYGHGLDATDSSEKPEQYAQMMSLLKKKDLFRVVQDFIILGEGAFQVTYNNQRKIEKLTYFPRQTLRAEKCNEKGEIDAYYYHRDWKEYNRNDKLKRIPVFGTSKEQNELFIVKKYVVGFHYYSLPSYSASMPYALLEEEISAYLINETQNGFSGTKVVNFNNGIPDKEKQIQIKNDILGKLTGSLGDKVIVAFNANQESSTTVEDISLNNAPEHYAYLAEECVKKLMVGHRITSPLLLGIRESGGGLGNNADEIQTATDLFLNIVIKPAQDIIIDALDDLLATNDIALNLYFKTLKPLDFMDEDTDLTDDQIEEETGIKQEDINEEKVEVDLKKIDGKLVFETPEEAEEQAEKLGCRGSHTHKDEDGKTWYMPCESHEDYPQSMSLSKENLTDEETKNVLGSLAKTGHKMSEEYVFVDEIDADNETDNKDWANYLITEKKSTLSKIKGLLGLADEIKSKNKGSSYSDLDSKNGLYKIRYTYAIGSRKPSKTQREFCRNMMNMANAGIVWTIEDIDRASREGVNRELGHNGQPFDLFKFKGGIYCRHKWRKVLYRLESNTEPSKNLGNYKKTRTIPKTYNRNPRGSKQAATAPENMPNRGAYPK
tara:strand:+ start:363 stop:2375 length:2013 start_codon:yes stop_codon:yes gene_type:complete